MKIRSSLPFVLVLALAAPVAASTAAPTTAPSNGVTVAKKKRSYCAAQAKQRKASSVAKVKSQKFFLFTNKRKNEYFYCSESPKRSGTIASSEGIAKTSQLRAVKGNCAVFYSEMKPGVPFDAGTKWLRSLPYSVLAKRSKFSTQRRIGLKADVVKLSQIKLAKNCVYTATFTVNGTPQLVVDSAGRYASYGAFRQFDLTGASDAELKAVKITPGARGSATITWTQAGVAKNYDVTPTN